MHEHLRRLLDPTAFGIGGHGEFGSSEDLTVVDEDRAVSAQLAQYFVDFDCADRQLSIVDLVVHLVTEPLPFELIFQLDEVRADLLTGEYRRVRLGRGIGFCGSSTRVVVGLRVGIRGRVRVGRVGIVALARIRVVRCRGIRLVAWFHGGVASRHCEEGGSDEIHRVVPHSGVPP